MHSTFAHTANIGRVYVNNVSMSQTDYEPLMVKLAIANDISEGGGSRLSRLQKGFADDITCLLSPKSLQTSPKMNILKWWVLHNLQQSKLTVYTRIK